MSDLDTLDKYAGYTNAYDKEADGWALIGIFSQIILNSVGWYIVAHTFVTWWMLIPLIIFALLFVGKKYSNAHDKNNEYIEGNKRYDKLVFSYGAGPLDQDWFKTSQEFKNNTRASIEKAEKGQNRRERMRLVNDAVYEWQITQHTLERAGWSDDDMEIVRQEIEIQKSTRNEL